MSQEMLSGTSFASFVAGEAITRGRALKLDTDGEVLHTTAITDLVIGVAMEDAASGATVTVATLNGQVVTAMASAAIASVPTEVMPAASAAGKLATAAGATAVSCGIALSSAAGDGSLFTLLLRPSVKSPANS